MAGNFHAPLPGHGEKTLSVPERNAMRKLITIAAATAVALVPTFLAAGPAFGAAPSAHQAARVSRAAAQGPAAKPTVVSVALPLPGGKTATVFSSGMAEVWSANHQWVEYRTIPPAPGAEAGTAAALPGKAELTWELTQAPPTPFAAGRVQVVLAGGVSARANSFSIPVAMLNRLRAGAAAGGAVPDYTSSGTLNRVLAGLGVARMTRLFPRLTGSAARTAVDPARAYVLQLTGASVPAAVSALLKSRQVAYAEPD